MPHLPEPAGPPSTPCYDYSRFGRHRLRAPNAAIIDLPLLVAPDAQVWVATIWPAPSTPAGWARQMWTYDPGIRRGWQLPHELAAGDVVEFGADTPTAVVRWCAVMDSYIVNEWATFQGPYPDPAAAWHDAQRLLALERFVEPLHAEPPTLPVTTAERNMPSRRRCNHRGRHPYRRGTNQI